jgi:chemotaxis protein histidine kinase CheA
MDFDTSILGEYAIEANELLDDAEQALLDIDKNPDVQNIYNLVFRAFHSLKGSAGMLGFDELQRHLHLLEDYLQKSKSNLDQFKASLDYYLSGIDAARKILNGEVVQFTYQNHAPSRANAESAKSIKKILYVSNSKMKLLADEILANEHDLDFMLYFKSVSELTDNSLEAEQYDILISDLSFVDLKTLIPAKKLKYPLILVVENIMPELKFENIFQVLTKPDEKIRIRLILQSALEARKNIELFEKAKRLLMYMYSDLEEYLIEKKKLDTQAVLNSELRSFIKEYSR